MLKAVGVADAETFGGLPGAKRAAFGGRLADLGQMFAIEY